MAAVFHFLTALLLVGFGTLIVGLVFMGYASKQSHDNPLRIVMSALATRIVTTIGVAIIDIPIAALEPIGGIVDVASLALVAFYWFTGLRQMMHAFDVPQPPTTLTHRP